ncbi:MAG: protein phosphatase 2C domain-containing protein [Acidobacteriota bacterium]
MTRAAGVTDVGRTRSSNEDCFLADLDTGLFAVADGMGGHNAGEVASRVAIDTLAGFVRSSRSDAGITWPFGFSTTLSFEANQLKSAIQLANQQVRYEAQRQPQYDGMGSTIVAVLVAGNRITFANVGDSRLYLVRGGMVSQLSHDDSWAASMARAGASPESIRKDAMRHVLTRALGTSPALDVEVRQAQVEPGDLLVLCSDGLYGPLGDDGLARMVGTTNAGDDLPGLARALVDAANAAGGPDNVTAVVVKPVVHGRLSQVGSESGQTLAEYLVAAGMLAAVGITLTAILVPALRDFVRNVAHAVSVAAP